MVEGSLMENVAPDSIPPTPSRLREAVRSGRPAEAVACLDATPPLRRAELFLQLRVPEQKAILVASTPELAAAILADCDSAMLGRVLVQLDMAGLGPAFQLIPPDNLADIVLHLPEKEARELEALLAPSLQEEVRKLLQFDPDSAGGMMNPRYLSVPDAVSVGRALEHLRRTKESESASYVYVVDAGGKLAGTVPLRKLLLADPRQPIRSLMTNAVVRLRAASRREEIVEAFRQHHFISLPIVDEKDRLVGIVTLDDVVAAVRQTEEQVAHGMTGVDPREVWKATLAAARGRIPWATVTILGGLGCTVIGGIFQATLAEMVVLGIFIPVVLALGESIGAQTMSVMLSTLSTGSLSRSELGSFIRKELLIGLLVGAYSGAAVALASLLWHGNTAVGLMIGVAIFLSIAWATLLALLVPTVMRRMKVDPVVASGPLVLTMADLSTLAIYLGGATVTLPWVR